MYPNNTITAILNTYLKSLKSVFNIFFMHISIIFFCLSLQEFCFDPGIIFECYVKSLELSNQQNIK